VNSVAGAKKLGAAAAAVRMVLACEQAQGIEAVHPLHARGRGDAKGSRVLHALRGFGRAEATGAQRQAWRAERLRRKRTAEAARPARAPERAIESETIAVLQGW